MTRRTRSRGGAGEDPLLAHLREAFDILRLPKALQTFEELLGSPEPERSRVEWLWALLEPQVTARVESRIERRIPRCSNGRRLRNLFVWKRSTSVRGESGSRIKWTSRRCPGFKGPMSFPRTDVSYRKGRFPG